MSISTIVYNNQLEWTCVRDDLYETIFNCIVKCVVDDNTEPKNCTLRENV